MQTRLVILEDATLANLAANPTAVQEFPLLSPLLSLAAPTTGCGRCRKQQISSANQQTLSSVKYAITRLPPDRKERFKQLIGAQQVRVRYLDPRTRRVIQHQF